VSACRKNYSDKGLCDVAYAIAHMNFDHLARERLSQLRLETAVSPWLYAIRSGVKVTFSVGRPVHSLTTHGVVTLDVTRPLRENATRLWRALAELELRACGIEVTASHVEELALALALPERFCLALFAEVGFDGELLEREQPYACVEWIATRLERLWPGTRLRLVPAGQAHS
jgi:hypothetical protein